MSQSESLRLTAEVVDKFTGPLGSLKKQMEALGREGGVHSDTLVRGFGKVEAGARSAEKAIASGLNPALGVVGVTGLSAAAAITGIAASMRSFAAGAASLGALSRETGQTADNLRVLGAVAGKFGVDQDAVASGTKAFAAQMREFGRGIGETYQWLNRQGRDPAGRKHFQDFAADLRSTTDRGEQLRKVLREMENIQDPVERGMFAEKFFGNADFGRLGDKHFGPILDMWRKTQEKLGKLDPAAVKAAEDFERTMSDLRTSMQKLGTTIGQEVLPYASGFTTWLGEIVGGQRSDVTKALRQGLTEIRKELDAINWREAGEAAKGFFTGSISFAGDLVKALKAAADLLAALKLLKDGDVAGALKMLGEADRKTDLGMGQGRAPGTIQDQMRGDTGPMMLRQAEIQRQLQVLDENIARKESGFDATGENHVVATEERARRERLIDETRKLGDEIRRLREDPAKKAPSGEATAQPSAFSGGEAGAGLNGLIHRASLGGLAGAAQVGQALGGGSGIVLPGGGRRHGNGGTGAGGGDRLFGGSGGIDLGDGLRGRPFGAPAAGSGADRAGRALRGAAGGDGLFGTPGAESGAARAGRAMRGEGGGAPGRTGEMMGYAMDQLRKEGVPEDQLRQAAAHLVGQATMESGLDPNKIHDQGTGYGIYGARDPKGWGSYRGARRSEMVRWLEANGFARNSAEGQMREMAHQAMSGRYPRTKAVLMGRGTGDLDRDTNTITGEFESPAVINRRSGAVRNALRAGPESVGPRAPAAAQIGEGLRQVRPWQKAPVDGGAAFSADFKRRQAEEDERRAGLKLGAGAQGALQASSGAQKVEADGKVHINIERPGPDTKVRTSASGTLFREIVQSRGRQMAAAAGD